jgi:hypothetical protein
MTTSARFSAPDFIITTAGNDWICRRHGACNRSDDSDRIYSLAVSLPASNSVIAVTTRHLKSSINRSLQRIGDPRALCGPASKPPRFGIIPLLRNNSHEMLEWAVRPSGSPLVPGEVGMEGTLSSSEVELLRSIMCSGKSDVIDERCAHHPTFQ